MLVNVQFLGGEQSTIHWLKYFSCLVLFYIQACTHRLLHIEGSFYTYPGRCIGAGSLEGNPLRTQKYETCEQKNQSKKTQDI